MSASIAPECNNIKEKYDTCFLKWYSEKYLRGNTASNECDELFAKYKTCLNIALKEKGIESMLDDARKVMKDSETD
ncbi:distribution and morphology protein 35 [Aspergillus heteromorphus CBS 117.55]|uniref:Distribution and morphology protein 35 n=1 Tax=Aspergillus heteromorphus CBS 117.55 TaxID=1448321 RepID=A0A317X4N9_9EURO|nr:distribution and morphology protein 35 [Aspergillus heteromorphus CBS 117.55]PWY92572.1 distribution and morphology protein 35 [Aspergillus heteromorphus CBS 117.55]